MSKKIWMFAMIMASTMALAVPAIAFAVDAPLHLIPKPAVTSTMEGGAMAISVTDGTTITCTKSHGTANWATTTSGTMALELSGTCTAHTPFGTIGCGSITFGTVPFELVTVPGAAGQGHKPGILITEPLGTFVCGGFLHFQIAGNGLIGTITAPACGGAANSATISFESNSHGIQKHNTVVTISTPGTTVTPTRYTPHQNGVHASLAAHFTMTFTQNHTLECT